MSILMMMMSLPEDDRCKCVECDGNNDKSDDVFSADYYDYFHFR